MWWFIFLVAIFAVVLVREISKDGRQIVSALCAGALVWLFYGKVQVAVLWLDTGGKGGLAQLWDAFVKGGAV